MGTAFLKGRKVYDTAFKFAVIEEYFSGNLSFYDFCKKKSLDRGTFNYWLLTFAPAGYLGSSEMGKEKNAVSPEEIREAPNASSTVKELELCRRRCVPTFAKRWSMLR
ncbi:MAG: hypothetical protein ACLVEJ_16120 [Parabacteroides sp.]